MKTIYKYEVPNTINVSADYKVLCVKMQNGRPYAWILHDPDRPSVEIEIDYVGTGWDLSDLDAEYLDTTFDPAGFVWHWFKRCVSN